MKVLVCVKQVFALDDEIVLRGDGRDIDPHYLEAGLNEWDAFAIEEALRLRETHNGEVVAATYGSSRADAVLRRALAMGADRAVRVEGEPSDPFTVAHGLTSLARRLEPDLILCGAQSSDSAHAATGSVLAGLLDFPCVAVVTSLQADPKGNFVDVARELEGGLSDQLRISLPAVLTVQTGINQPRYANLRAIKLAEREAIEVICADDSEPAYRVRRMFTPAKGGHAKPLGADLGEAAERIAQLIRERV
jgi:electron transfer flavoprotein beta subunit